MSDTLEITPGEKEGTGEFVVNEATYNVKYKLRVSAEPQPTISGTVTNLDTQDTEKMVAFRNIGGKVGTLHLDDGSCLEIWLNKVDYLKEQGKVRAASGKGFYLCNED